MLTTAVIAVLALSGAAGAEESCEKIADPLQRLECFDRTARAAALIKKPEKRTSGSWKLEKLINPVDDSVLVVVRLRARKRLGGSRPTLFLQCERGALNAYVVTTVVFEGAAHVHVAYRIDRQPPVRTRWRIGSDGVTLIFPEPAVQLVALLRELHTASTLVFEVGPSEATRTSTTFAVGSLNYGLLDELKDACPAAWREAEQALGPHVVRTPEGTVRLDGTGMPTPPLPPAVP